MFSFTTIGCSGQSEWEIVSVADFSELRSEERISAKTLQRDDQQKQLPLWAEERLQMAEERAQQAEQQIMIMEQDRESLEQKAKQAELRANEYQRRLDLERRETERLAIQLEDRERMLQQAQKRTQQAEAMVQWERKRGQGAEERMQFEKEKTQRVEKGGQETQKRAQQTEAKVDEMQTRLYEIEEKEWEKLVVQKKERESIQEEGEKAKHEEVGIEVVEVEVGAQQESHLSEVKKDDFFVQLDEERAKSLDWRLQKVEERETVQLAVQQLRLETQEAGENARQATMVVERMELEKQHVQQKRHAVQQQAVATKQIGL